MAEYYFSVNAESNKSLCIAPLTDRRLAASGQEITDRWGYFLYELDGTGEDAGVEILAHAVSAEAAFKLSKLLKMR